MPSKLPLLIGIGTRIRKSPYFDSTLKYGVTGFTFITKCIYLLAFQILKKNILA